MSTQVGPANNIVRIDRDKLLSTINLSDVIGQDQQIYRDGREFKTLCPWHADKNPSLRIVDAKGFYYCFSCGAHGSAIDWIMFQNGCDFRTACEKLGYMQDHAVVPKLSAPRIAKKSEPYAAIIATNDEPPDMELRAYDDKPALGKPVRVWTYRTRDGRVLGYVARYRDDDDGTKQVRTWTYGSFPTSKVAHERTIRWRCKRWAEPYPLYGLEKLNDPDRANQPIVIVSGEKCAEAAQAIMPNSIVMTWPGGDKAVEYVDWEPIAGRSILMLWPDADESGRAAMQWIANEVGPMITGTVWIMSVDDPDLPKGWDVADAVETDGKGAEWLDKFRSNILPDGLPRLRRINKAPIPAAIIKEQQNGLPDETPIVDVERKMLGHEPIVDGDATERWYNKPWKHRFMTGGQDNQQLIKCDHNIAVPLRYAPELQGAIRFNSISKKIEKSRPLPWGEAPGEWKATTTTRLLAWLNKMGLYYSKEMMEDAVSVVAEEMEFNPLVEYLEQLKWDGRPRVEEWLSTYTGAASNLYTREIGKRWMVSAIARGMQPGCKADSMIVMEGNEGTRKSTTLRALGTPAGEYFAQLRGSIGGSDFRANFQAATHWIIELGELEAVNRTQWESLKDFLSTQSESVRLAYHKHQQTLYRSCVFAGTVNETRGGWLPLDGDHRRFWPVRVNYCDLDGIMRDRDQLWAEARALFESGQKWWIDPDETELMGVVKVERDERKFNDEWVGAVSTWLDRPQQWQDEFAMRDIAWGALSISADRLDKATQLRLGKVLVAAGMERVKVRRGGETVWMWRKPGATAPISDEL